MTAATDTPEIDDFIDALWLEDGLSKNTLAAYRRDLALFAQWLQAQRGSALDAARETDLQAYMGAKLSDKGKATSANRRLTVFKRYFRWALREQMSIREIARRTGLSRDTVKKYLRAGEEAPRYAKRASSSKLNPYADKLATWLAIEATKSRKQRRNLRQIHTKENIKHLSTS